MQRMPINPTLQDGLPHIVLLGQHQAMGLATVGFRTMLIVLIYPREESSQGLVVAGDTYVEPLILEASLQRTLG